MFIPALTRFHRARPVNAICQTSPRVLEKDLSEGENAALKDFLASVVDE